MARSAAKRVAGTLLFLVALVAVLVFYFLLFADSRQVNDVPGVGNMAGVAVAVAVLLGLVAIILLALVASRGRTREEPVEAENTYFVPPEPQPIQPYGAFEEVDDDLVVYDVWRLPSAKRSWAVEERGQAAYYFPLNVDGGVYVNDYLPIGGGQRLKLRTLLAGPPDVEAAAFTIPSTGRAPRTDRPAPRWEPEARPARPEPRAPESRPSDRPSRPGRDVPGDNFMRELERRFSERGDGPQVAVQSPESAYYDYAGDIHDVLDVEGIGPVYADRLRQMGVHTTARLCYEDAGRIAQAVGVPRKTAESWQAMAQLMKVHGIGQQYAEAMARAGIDIEALRRRSPAAVADEVNAHLDTIGATVTGQRLSERRVATWQQAARQMRRTRMRVPEK